MQSKQEIRRPWAVEFTADPYAASGTTAGEFLKAIQSFQNSNDPQIIHLRKVTSEISEQIHNE